MIKKKAVLAVWKGSSKTADAVREEIIERWGEKEVVYLPIAY